MKLSLIIPIFNEAKHLPSFLKEIDTLEIQCDIELVLIDDFSSDQTLQILKTFPFNTSHIIVQHTRNQGKGAAIRSGLAHATGEIIGIQDADFEYSFKDIATLIAPIIHDQADIVFGSRYKNSRPSTQGLLHYSANQLLTIASNLCNGLALTDMETCYKFFKAEILKNINLESNRFGFEPEITAKIAKLNIRLEEKAIEYSARKYSEGKKISWKDGLAACRHVIFFNLLQDQEGIYKPELPSKYRR